MKWYSSLTFALLAVSASAAVIPAAELRSKAAKGLRLISLEEGAEPVWKTEAQVLDLIKDDVGFFDVTDFYDSNDASSRGVSAASAQVEVEYGALQHTDKVTALLASVSVTQMQSYLTQLTSYNNRYYKATTGATAADWIYSTMLAVANANPATGAKVSQFTHSGFNQKSIIGTIPGSNPSAARVILGAHMDSINNGNPSSGRAPGADDDGSGTVNVMEAFRVLVVNGFKPTATVEFHLYAGEEAGLLGSNAIARSYKSSNIAVAGMLNLDMTAFIRAGTTQVIGLLPDYTNTALTRRVGELIDTHLSVAWVTSSRCGYGCSDHASWYNQGFASAAALEGDKANLNSALHTTSDLTSINGFNWNHSAQFANLAVAFATELGA
ncbi:aminopeptidase [Coprinopsis sp. MPI-PUGE-AT-0042]|nr:aminopeptidase [Coprinopsis sp. MPI-PUGE-AT-0042]